MGKRIKINWIVGLLMVIFMQSCYHCTYYFYSKSDFSQKQMIEKSYRYGFGDSYFTFDAVAYKKNEISISLIKSRRPQLDSAGIKIIIVNTYVAFIGSNDTLKQIPDREIWRYTTHKIRRKIKKYPGIKATFKYQIDSLGFKRELIQNFELLKERDCFFIPIVLH